MQTTLCRVQYIYSLVRKRAKISHLFMNFRTALVYVCVNIYFLPQDNFIICDDIMFFDPLKN